MKRYRVDFGYGRYFFDEREDGDWVRFEDHEARVRQELSLAEEGLANYAQEVERLTLHKDVAQKHIDALTNQYERLRITLEGISACSTCEMCQGAALATLRHQPQSALLCTNCGKPLDDHGGAGLPCPT